MLARGWLAYPVTPGCPICAIHHHRRKPPKSGCINAIPVCARGALLLVTPSARRDSGGRMGHRRTPSLCASEMRYFPLSARRIPIEKTAHHHPIAPTARCEKTAEERFHMLARGWLAYPVTSMHSQLPPKSGCRNPIPRFAILVLFDYFRNKMFYELHRCIIPHRFFDKRPRSHSRQRASR